jgi:hypothetical protein
MNLGRFRWTQSWSGVVAFAIVVWAVVYFTANQAGYAVQRGNNLSDVIDSYSEANTVRAGEGYFDHGFTFDYGLPDLGYGSAFEAQGGKHDPNLCPQLPCVYLHEPMGGEALIGLMTDMCGKGNVPCLRIAPITVGFLCLAILACTATLAMGIRRAAFVLGSFYFAPMLTNGMHHLVYHSHLVSLVFAYSGLLLVAFVRPPKDMRKLYVALFLVSFLYGCLAYDYVFHVMFMPAVFWLMSEHVRADLKKAFLITVIVCGAYGAAIILHFIQVRMYLGSWDAFLADFVARARIRLGGHLEAANPALPPVRLLLVYWTKFLLEPQYLGYSFLGASAACAALLSAPRAVTVSKNWALEWAPRPSFKWAFLVAFLIPDLWLLVMRQHASVHGHFLPRNFSVVYTTGAILLALSLRKAESSAAPAQAAAERGPEELTASVASTPA